MRTTTETTTTTSAHTTHEQRSPTPTPIAVFVCSALVPPLVVVQERTPMYLFVIQNWGVWGGGVKPGYSGQCNEPGSSSNPQLLHG